MSALRNSLLGGLAALALGSAMMGADTATAAAAHNAPLAAKATAFEIRNTHNLKCLEIANSSKSNGARAQQWTCKEQAGAAWTLRHVKGIYYIVNARSGKCLEIANSSKSNGARAQQWTCKGQAGAKWRLVLDRHGNWQIVNNHSGKCLEIANSSKSNGARAQQWTCKEQAGSQWIW
ncbi:RICIN domain-containing protein [Streptomyces sp. NPDC048718]|uniref:RICIN domain-containing protein n=1 Tax=Streptomyces sp. NPDC048718 TaxID=3365587 RepID=UPI003718A9CF